MEEIEYKQISTNVQKQIKINQDIKFQEQKSFNDAGISSYLAKCYHTLNYHHPTPIQYYSLQSQMQLSIIAQSKSGTGKTLSFLSILLNHFLAHPPLNTHICSYLIVLPTRQLALQVYQTLKQITTSFLTVKTSSQQQKQARTKLKQLRAMLCIGGIPFEDDRRNYLNNGGTVVVGTIGRVLEFVEKRLVKIPELQMLVLDQGDKLFENRNKKFNCFVDNVLKYTILGEFKIKVLIYSATFTIKLLKELNKKRKYLFIQTLANSSELAVSILDDFTAIEGLQTITDQTKDTSDAIINLQNIKKYKLIPKTESLSPFNAKVAVLTQLLHELQYRRCLVFVEKKTLLEQLNQRIIQANLEPLLIHGSLSQSSRIKLMNQVNHSKIIIASDLLARGIDLELDLVVLFDAKKNDTFWHRIGRTGRFGKLGVAISLDDIEYWQNYNREDVQEQLTLIEHSFNKQKQWYGTYLTQIGHWSETNHEKEQQMQQQFKYFNENKHQNGRKCIKRDKQYTKPHTHPTLASIKSPQKLQELVHTILNCQYCQSLMLQIQNLTNYKFKIKDLFPQ